MAFSKNVPARLPAPLDSAAIVYWPVLPNSIWALSSTAMLWFTGAFMESNGELGGFDRGGAALSSITVVEQDAFSHYAANLSEALIEASASQRQLNTLAWYLDALDSYHGCGVLGAAKPASIIVKVIDNLTPSSSGRWHLNGARLHVHPREQNCVPSMRMLNSTLSKETTTSCTSAS